MSPYIHAEISYKVSHMHIQLDIATYACCTCPQSYMHDKVVSNAAVYWQVAQAPALSIQWQRNHLVSTQHDSLLSPKPMKVQ